jgi:hypothetical protein
MVTARRMMGALIARRTLGGCVLERARRLSLSARIVGMARWRRARPAMMGIVSLTTAARIAASMLVGHAMELAPTSVAIVVTA